jgi:hypothetical protein
VKCVAVWDTVGSYGIPAGFGLAALARYVTLAVLGFHDTGFGYCVAVSLHAVCVDEHRRPFVPTFWTIAKGQQPRGQVEQTWFAGAQCNVGGGYTDSGLSDLALIWLISRIKALTGLEFDVSAEPAHNLIFSGSVVDSTVGWPVDHTLPHYRKISLPSPSVTAISPTPKNLEKSTSTRAFIGVSSSSAGIWPNTILQTCLRRFRSTSGCHDR